LIITNMKLIIKHTSGKFLIVKYPGWLKPQLELTSKIEEATILLKDAMQDDYLEAILEENKNIVEGQRGDVKCTASDFAYHRVRIDKSTEEPNSYKVFVADKPTKIKW
jgi:hypothetical protein